MLQQFPFYQAQNDQFYQAQSDQFYQAQIDQPIPIAEPSMLIDLDKDLNITDKEHINGTPMSQSHTNITPMLQSHQSHTNVTKS